MRISTTQLYDSGANGLLRNQYDLYKLQNQFSTGRRVVTPADDPVAASQALVTEQKLNVNQQFLDNQGNARAQLAELESLMASVGTSLIDVKSRWVEAGNGAYSDSELKAIAVDLRSKFQEFLGIANSADANGLYRFAGYQGATQPFVQEGGQVQYKGDSGARQLQVEASRFMEVSYSGRQFFEAIPEGNGVFVTGADTGNTGSGVISNGSVLTAYSGNNYRLEFTRTPDPLYPTDTTKDTVEYSIYEWAPGAAMPGTPTSGPFAYKSGDAIFLPDPTDPTKELNVVITGDPATNDSFTLRPSATESLFTTLDTFIQTLEQGNKSDPAAFQNAMLRIGASIDQGIQHVLDGRADVGARMAELDSLSALGGDLDVQYQSQISDLVDLDYTKAITDLSRNLLQLQAAQQSFMKVTGLSLFNFL
ncbi:MAG: flagellar hook-associated protein FlgL [Azovibrio sp.]|uniref:flagellar hook-associated protein FlgL n=1 Tax=Azovibrio sp. TaxID=1872673 RepID=UPI003C73BE5D